MISHYLITDGVLTLEEIAEIAADLEIDSYSTMMRIPPVYAELNVSDANDGWSGTGTAPSGTTIAIADLLASQHWVWIREEIIYPPETISKVIALPLTGTNISNFVSVSGSTWKSLGCYFVSAGEVTPTYVKAVVDSNGSTLEIQVKRLEDNIVLWQKTITDAGIVNVTLDVASPSSGVEGILEVRAKRSTGTTAARVYSVKMEIV